MDATWYNFLNLNIWYSLIRGAIWPSFSKSMGVIALATPILKTTLDYRFKVFTRINQIFHLILFYNSKFLVMNYIITFFFLLSLLIGNKINTLLSDFFWENAFLYFLRKLVGSTIFHVVAIGRHRGCRSPTKYIWVGIDRF